ncbi:MAG: aspartate aminotransferase family protein [Verrucomicrobia bacterium]|nr:aspartate aminotransferase family protein [Verrucomicrobiota bacterium]MBI3868161.1 aspartate aminotransferase family protein [Verrucomicrobiota bacterium]
MAQASHPPPASVGFASMSSSSALRQLQRYESRNVTFIDPDGSWPIVWKRARGVRVWDEEGRGFLDLTAGFGVAAAGHAHPAVVRAGQRQLAELPHAMGDVHPHALKGRLARELSQLTFERWSRNRPRRSAIPLEGKSIFCNSGSEAVEAALKTAVRAAGKQDIIAFEGGYHGLGYGALNATHRAHFRERLEGQLGGFGHFAPFPEAGQEARRGPSLRQVQRELEALIRKHPVGAILVEPFQARGGIRIPPPGFLRLLRSLCDRHGALLILDEIYTGFGRTGKWFACEHEGVTPDVVCLGKALTGGFPLSACVGRSDIMDQAWPPSNGEAIHTSTFLGNPVGCAMALAQISALRNERLVARSARIGKFLLAALQGSARDFAQAGRHVVARGVGLMAGLEFLNRDGSADANTALGIVKQLLQEGIIVLPEGERSNVIGFTPPLTVSEAQLQRATAALRRLAR